MERKIEKLKEGREKKKKDKNESSRDKAKIITVTLKETWVVGRCFARQYEAYKFLVYMSHFFSDR